MLLLVLAEQLPRRLRRLGAGRPVELPAHRLLVPQAHRGAGRQEGVHRQPRRRRRLRARDHAHLRQPRHARHPRGPSSGSASSTPTTIVVVIALLIFAGRDGQERPVPAPRLAAGRDGGPDPGVRPDPRRDDGQRRRLPRRPLQPDLRHAPRTRWSSSPAIGIFTAILAASIAMTQTDIKRVLAYSTLSQLGYMFAAFGVGAWTAAIFHLMTHGFFKGLLFLGSGLGHPRRPRGAGHAQDGRPVARRSRSPT